MFQEGAQVPGEEVEAVSREGHVLRGEGPGFPYRMVAFSQDLPEQRSPRDPLWEKGRSHP